MKYLLTLQGSKRKEKFHTVEDIDVKSSVFHRLRKKNLINRLVERAITVFVLPCSSAEY